MKYKIIQSRLSSLQNELNSDNKDGYEFVCKLTEYITKENDYSCIYITYLMRKIDL